MGEKGEESYLLYGGTICMSLILQGKDRKHMHPSKKNREGGDGERQEDYELREEVELEVTFLN